MTKRVTQAPPRAWFASRLHTGDTPMNKDEIWRLEERFWLDDDSFYEAHLGEQCVMAFAAPVGVLDAEKVRDSLKGAPRWTSVTMSDGVVGQPDAATLVVGYRATGNRSGSASYAAFCNSTYRRDGQTWKLVQHQQTPV
jgi:hypothetical protein